MPSLKAIRKRISSVKNTKKITAAMKLVAGARLRRAQDGIVAARPYALHMQEAIAELAARAGSESHPLLARRDEKNVAMIVLTSDRGLCGAFNSNVNRRVERFVIDNSDRFTSVKLSIVGRKGREYFRRRPSKVSSIQREWSAPATAAQAQLLAQEIAATLMAAFLPPPPDENGATAAPAVDAVYIVYNEFKSAISQNVTVVPLLPVAPTVLDDSFGNNDFLYEPSRDELLSHLVPLYVQSQIYRGLLESIASEFGSRMSAMDSATKNASEMIGSLTLQFNRARQAAITKELMEIIGGSEALKG
jgi:F-type H+-transporting ATPase subunit gamma